MDRETTEIIHDLKNLKQSLIFNRRMRLSRSPLEHMLVHMRWERSLYIHGDGEDKHLVKYVSKPEGGSVKLRHCMSIAYVEGASHIILSTDNQPLRLLLSLKSLTVRLARWTLQIQRSNREIKYLCDKRNIIADFLSRLCRHRNDFTILAL